MKSQYAIATYRLPAEWEEQYAVMLTWPHEDTDWKPYLDDITDTFTQLTAIIANYESVIIAARHPDRVLQRLQEHLSEAQLNRLQIYPCESNDTWARDHGPITLVPTRQHLRPLMLDFKFNGWGEKFKWESDNAVTSSLFALNALPFEYSGNKDFVLEGGSIESDGKGTILTTSHCLLAPHRNQPMSRDEIETTLKLRLGADRVIWIENGRLTGDDTDGHIDTLVRLAPDDTLLYVSCDNPDDEHYAELKLMEEQLKTLTTQSGNHYQLIPLPLPRPIFDGEDRLPATYANFLIINGAVVVPTYQQPDNDARAKTAIARAFPHRNIVGIDACTVIRQHGSIHCLTMQLPQMASTTTQE